MGNAGFLLLRRRETDCYTPKVRRAMQDILSISCDPQRVDPVKEFSL
jgi:hypothetical protein